MTTSRQPTWYHTDSEWADVLQYGYEHYMDSLMMSIDGSDTDTMFDIFADYETETGFAFCGCQDCHTRETLAYIIPRVIKGYLDGKLRYEE